MSVYSSCGCPREYGILTWGGPQPTRRGDAYCLRLLARRAPRMASLATVKAYVVTCYYAVKSSSVSSCQKEYTVNTIMHTTGSRNQGRGMQLADR